MGDYKTAKNAEKRRKREIGVSSERYSYSDRSGKVKMGVAEMTGQE